HALRGAVAVIGGEPADDSAGPAVCRVGHDRWRDRSEFERAAAKTVRYGARSGDRDAVCDARRKVGAIGRHGGEECGGGRYVAGLDMGKLMIGSFGTLAAIASVNFKLIPMPGRTRTFLMPFHSAEAAMRGRALIYESSLQPYALDILNPAAAQAIGQSSYVLL